LRRRLSICRIEAADERELCGEELRVSGEVVEMEMEEGEMERVEREGEKAVRRRWREVEVVKDWKRFERVDMVGCC